MYDDVVCFFQRSTHCTPEVLRRVVDDIDGVVCAYKWRWCVTRWGGTALPSLCVYGGLPLCMRDEASDALVLPLQAWLTHQHPVEPPRVYVAACDVSTALRLAAAHPCVDASGRCYCTALAEWRPTSSSLQGVLESLAAAIEASGVCPLQRVCASDDSVCRDSATTTAARGSCVVCFAAACDVVLVPCGHHCLCAACAAAVDDCPVCRTAIRVRQAIAM